MQTTNTKYVTSLQSNWGRLAVVLGCATIVAGLALSAYADHYDGHAAAGQKHGHFGAKVPQEYLKVISPATKEIPGKSGKLKVNTGGNSAKYESAKFGGQVIDVLAAHTYDASGNPEFYVAASFKDKQGRNYKVGEKITLDAGQTPHYTVNPIPKVAATRETRSPVERAVAIGAKAKVTQDGGVAIGAGAEVSGENSIAIGADVKAGENEIVIGKDGQTAVIGGVALSGIATNTGNIAANTGNIATNTGNITANTGNINTNRSGIAMAMAMSNLPTIKGGNGGWGIAGGSFDGESALAVGANFNLENEGIVKISISSSGGGTGFGVGYGMGF